MAAAAAGFQARWMMRAGSRGFGMRKPCLVLWWWSWSILREERNEVLHRDRDAGAGTGTGTGTGTMTTINRGPSPKLKGPLLLVPAGRMQLFRYMCWNDNPAAGHD